MPYAVTRGIVSFFFKLFGHMQYCHIQCTAELVIKSTCTPVMSFAEECGPAFRTQHADHLQLVCSGLCEFVLVGFVAVFKQATGDRFSVPLSWLRFFQSYSVHIWVSKCLSSIMVMVTAYRSMWLSKTVFCLMARPGDVFLIWSLYLMLTFSV